VLSNSTVLTLFAAILCSSATQAEEGKEQTTLSGVFESFGFHSDPKVSGTDCNVQMNLNQKVFFDHFSELQQLGALE
jgi:hypothetical protein